MGYLYVTMVTYRALEPRDADAVAQLALHAGLIAWHPEVHATMSWAHALREQDQGRALGAFADSTLVGVLVLRCLQHRRRSHNATFYLGVHPAHRRQGIGARLLQEALRLADWMQVGRLETAAYAHQPEALAFFARHGFRAAVQQRAALRLGDEAFDRTVLEHLRPTFAWKPGQMPQPPSKPRASGPLRIEIRRTTPDDAASMPELMHSAAVLWGTLQLPWSSEALWRGRFSDPGATGWTALAEGRPVGCASLHACEAPAHGHTAGLGMSVHPDYHGRGIGRRLMEALLAHADGVPGLRRLELEVYTDNPPAQALYARTGFLEEGGRRAESWRYDGYADTLSMARLRD